jgi:hypothetical protein
VVNLLSVLAKERMDVIFLGTKFEALGVLAGTETLVILFM